MSELKGPVEREAVPPTSELSAKLSAPSAEPRSERVHPRAGALSLGGWMGALLDQLDDDQLPRS
jgi:hypothetical protein